MIGLFEYLVFEVVDDVVFFGYFDKVDWWNDFEFWM